MTSQNNSLKSHQGSALIVTILLVSVLLATALILLQRIIPYAKSVRSMHDASQAYYIARGQADLARLNFLYGGGGSLLSLQFPSIFGLLSSQEATETDDEKPPSPSRGNISTPQTSGTANYTQLFFREQQPQSGIFIPEIGIPFKSADGKKSDLVVVSGNKQSPLTIRLFPTDDNTENFGTSKTSRLYHTLNSRNAGGLRFDLKGVNMSATDFTLKLKLPSTVSNTVKVILKMQYLSKELNASVQSFTAEYPYTEFTNGDTVPSSILPFTSSSTPGNIQLIAVNSTITSIPGKSFQDFLQKTNLPEPYTHPIDCRGALICNLSLVLNDSGSNQSIDFQLISSAQIPDLNAVVIGDGLSGNGLYYQRIIDFIPTPQDI